LHPSKYTLNWSIFFRFNCACVVKPLAGQTEQTWHSLAHAVKTEGKTVPRVWGPLWLCFYSHSVFCGQIKSYYLRNAECGQIYSWTCCSPGEIHKTSHVVKWPGEALIAGHTSAVCMVVHFISCCLTL
jgi:hypothetical protein